MLDAGGPGAGLCRPSAGKNMRRDLRYRTKPEKSGGGPISAIPVVEVISVVFPAAEWVDARSLFRPKVASEPFPEQVWHTNVVERTLHQHRGPIAKSFHDHPLVL